MKRNGTPKATMELQPFALSHYDGHYFRNTMPCDSCGAAANKRYAAEGFNRDVLDEYDLTLREEAYRLAHHANASIANGQYDSAAGMLRDAARLLDLFGQRLRTRREEEERKPRRKAARS